jgi:RNA polymerase sigma-70 factor (ECF subfamily)
VRMHGINWPVVRFERRRPSWRQQFRHTEGSLNRYACLTSSMRERARKDLKETKVSAPRQSETPEMTDENVVRLAQQGDVAAFERIYRLHSRKIYSLCLRMAGDASEAEDLTQEVFLQLFRKISTFRGESAFSTWLHRMAVNIVLMRFRKKNIANQSLEAITNPDEESGKPSEEFGGPDLRLNGVVDRITLETAINELAPGYKAMFILHDVQGYNHDEIAEIFGCTPGNSKSQVHKARVRLRELLQQSVEDVTHRHRKSLRGALALGRLKYTFDYADA